MWLDLEKTTIAVYDIETESIPREGASRITTTHCVGITILRNGIEEPTKVFTNYYLEGTDGNLRAAVDLINSCEYVSGHNIINFDNPTLSRITRIPITSKPLDTLLITKLMFSKNNLFSIDMSIEDFPKDLYGSYSLKAFGIRLGGEQKLEFSDWSRLSTEMIVYMRRDITVSVALLKFLLASSKFPTLGVLELEQNAAVLIEEQEAYGFHFDIESAVVLNTSLLKEKLTIEHALKKFYPAFYLKDGPLKSTKKPLKQKKWLPATKYTSTWKTLTTWSIPLSTYKNGKFKFPPKSKTHWTSSPVRLTYIYKNGEYQPIKYTSINLGSRNHIRIWIERLYGLTFLSFSAKGQPQVSYESIDELILAIEGTGMEDVLFQLNQLRRYFKVVKDQGQLQSLIESIRSDSSITSRIDTLGTNTGRFTSSGGKDSEKKAKAVNLSQLPSQEEFRSLFNTPTYYTLEDTLYNKVAIYL